MKFNPAKILPVCIETEKIFDFIVLVRRHLCSSFCPFLYCLTFMVPYISFRLLCRQPTLQFVTVACYFGIAFIVLVHCSVFQPTLPSGHFAVCARYVLFGIAFIVLVTSSVFQTTLPSGHSAVCAGYVLFWYYYVTFIVLVHCSVFQPTFPSAHFAVCAVILVLYSLSLFIVLYFILLCRQSTLQSVIVPCCLVFVCCLHFGNRWF